MAYNPNNPNGQAASANSAPVVIASDQTALTTKISDGTTTANTMAGDTGQNALIISSGRKDVAFSTTTVQAVATTDVSNYRWIAVHITGQGTSSTVTFQTSNDNTNWVAQSMQLTSATNSTPTSTATASNVIYSGPVIGRYFRLNVTGISAGTTAGIVSFSSMPGAFQSVGINGSMTITPTSSATALTSFSNTAVTNTVLTVKGTSGRGYDFHVDNTNSSAIYLQIFDVASATTVTLGTTAPTFTLGIPANGALDRAMTYPYSFTNGIKIAATTTPTGSTAPTNPLNVSIGYL